MSPSEEIPPLSERELELLREVGRHWAEAIGPRKRQLTALPVDPTLRRVSKRLQPTRFGRIAPVQMFEPRRRGEAVATEPERLRPDEQPFSIGQNVRHAKFGDGVVIDFEGRGLDARVQVRFSSEGTKWLALQYAKLTAV